MFRLFEAVGKAIAPSGARSFEGQTLQTLNPGVGYGVLTLAIVSYTPRFTVGSSDGQTALGFRHSVAGHFLLSVIYLELSHEVLRAGAITSHDIQLSAGLNVGTLLIPLFF